MVVPGLDAWQPWSPQTVHRNFASLAAPWCFVGGWAIDLWLGRQTREHEDIEVTVLRKDLDRFQAALPACDFFAAGSGQVTWLEPGEALPDAIHQVWCLDRALQSWVLDVMIEPGTDAIWRYKRDPSFQFPRHEMVQLAADGLPILRPEAVLLFKAKSTRPKDEADFEVCLGRLENRTWLAEALQRFHPTHSWNRRLASKI
jgi:hypothetical protein